MQKREMTKIGLMTVLAASALASGAWAGPWWDDFPRMVEDNAVSVVSNCHGNAAMNGMGQDPTWGTFYQRNGIVHSTAQAKAFQNAGIKQIGYYEAYGQNYCLIAELGAWDQTNLTPVLHHYWNWSEYAGGTTRWLGVHNFFNDDEFARPYTRTHPRYGGPAMTYPDGTVAAGYDGPATDPRNSRVYDAACSKNILGEFVVDEFHYADGPTNGLVYVAEADDYAGLIYFRKDSACPLWNDYTYASVLQAADAGGDGMWNDNYGAWDSLGIHPVEKGFGEWSVARFRDHLTNHFSVVELERLGIANAAQFDIREHLKAVAMGRGWDGSNLEHPVWSSAEWLNDPLWRAYLIFKRQVGAEALSGCFLWPATTCPDLTLAGAAAISTWSARNCPWGGRFVEERPDSRRRRSDATHRSTSWPANTPGAALSLCGCTTTTMSTSCRTRNFAG